jgi:hypothetical protein
MPGFTPAETELAAHRGGSVTWSNGVTVIRISADWLEGEMYVDVFTDRGSRPPGDADVADGVRLSRLPRAATSGQLEARLREAIDRLTRKRPELFE